MRARRRGRGLTQRMLTQRISNLLMFLERSLLGQG
jgi:hypothetical protein